MMPLCDPLSLPTPLAVPAWYTKLQPQQVRPNPTGAVLHDQLPPV